LYRSASIVGGRGVAQSLWRLGYGLDDHGLIPGRGNNAILFSAPPRPDRFWAPPQPPIHWIPVALSPWIKHPEREADRPPPSSAEVKNAWSYTSIPPVRLHSVVVS